MTSRKRAKKKKKDLKGEIEMKYKYENKKGTLAHYKELVIKQTHLKNNINDLKKRGLCYTDTYDLLVEESNKIQRGIHDFENKYRKGVHMK